MKTIRNLLLVGAVVVFCGSMANAQIIYSNAFDGPATNIHGTAPNVANNLAGGTNTAVWNDVLGINNTNFLFANGSNYCTSEDSWILPFTPQSGHYYTITAKMTWQAAAGPDGDWIGFGFCQHFPTNLPVGYLANGDSRFSDQPVVGVDWIICQPGIGEQWFAGPTNFPTVSGLANGNAMPTDGTYTVTINLDTRATQWVMSCYINGVQFGTDYTYPVANPTIRGVGLTQTHLASPTNFTWGNFTLTTAVLPIINQQPTSQAVGLGAAYTNTVQAFADTDAGTLSYQWYNNDVAVSAASSNSTLVINPVALSDAGTNYYVVVSDLYGSVTSAPVTLTVLTNPVFTATIPASYTNVTTLFGGGNIGGTNYFGSSPTFSVSVAGAYPITYEWLTNGVLVGGASGSSYTFSNCQMNSPTNFTCIAANSYGRLTNSWSVAYVAAPTAPYPQAVLADQPIAFWRLNEPGTDNGSYDNGDLCHDYQSGNNGIYTNMYLGDPGYDSSHQPGLTAAYFGTVNPSIAGQIQGVNFATPAGHNAEFTVEAWVEGYGGTSGAAIITKGIYQVNDSFALNLSRATAAPYYEFSVRSTILYPAISSVPTDGAWHFLVGVCDEANSNVTLYVDGVKAGETNIPPGAGVVGNDQPVIIGAGSSSSSHIGDIQLTADMNDVAAYNYALSPLQVAKQYLAVNPNLSAKAPLFVQTPPTSITTNAGSTVVIPASVLGSASMGYYWTNVTAGSFVAGGATNGALLDASLNIASISNSWNGDQLELVVTNAYGSANASVALTINSGVNSTPTNMVFSVTGGTNLLLSWPADHTGWTLQAQTNSLAVGLSTNWVDVSGSSITNQVTMPINPTNGTVFYRLIYTP